MTDKALAILPEALRNRFSKIKLKDSRKVIIASSVTPYSVVASSILCRTFLNTNTLFHVMFFDNMVSIDQLNQHIKTNPDALIITIGLDIIGTLSSKHKQVLSVGSRFHSTLKDVHIAPLDFPVAAESLALAAETGTVQHDEIALATVGSLLESPKHKMTEAMVDVCIKEGILLSRKGFRIPGFNFLSMDEVFSGNIHPYLDSLSGAPEACHRIYEEADISFSKWSTPLSQLSPDEARQLNAVLLLSLSSSAIPHVLGSDYEIPHEKESSPFRHISSISSISRVIWSTHEMGLLLGVLIGDRARLMNTILETYRKYCEETITSVAEVNILLNEREGKATFHDTYISIDTSHLPDTTLADVGRITLQSAIAKEAKFLIMVSKESATVTWKESISLLSVLVELLNQNIPFTSTSPQSVRIDDTSDETLEKTKDVLKSLTTG